MTLQVRTAREALLAIRYRIKEGGGDINGLLGGVDKLCKDGLGEHTLLRPMDFELSDQLADRLAQAHKVLREWDREGSPDNTELEDRTSEALTLPPDLEAMVERRIGPR